MTTSNKCLMQVSCANIHVGYKTFARFNSQLLVGGVACGHNHYWKFENLTTLYSHRLVPIAVYERLAISHPCTHLLTKLTPKSLLGLELILWQVCADSQTCPMQVVLNVLLP